MKVVVVNVQGSGSPFIEAGLEIAQGHVDKGDEVVFLYCAADLLACESNNVHDPLLCLQCVARRNTGLALIAPAIKAQSFLNLTPAQQDEMVKLQTRFSTLDELRSYTIENFDIGMGVLSSVVSYTRNPIPDLKANADFIERLVKSGYAVFRSIQNYLDDHTVDKMYVLCGRTVNPRAVIRACQSRAVKYTVYENAHSMHHYGLWDSATPHSIDYTANEMRKLWQAASLDPGRDIKAAEFFQERAKGRPKEGVSFVSDQVKDLLPQNWNAKKCNVAVFTTSEDEFVAVSDEWQHKLYKSQIDGLRKISESLRDQGDKLHVYLRMHPNSRGLPDSYNQQFLQLESDFLTVIPPTAPVSTYALLRAADKVVTFGSTMGIEAVFWGKPSILVGASFYQDLGGTYNPESHNELIDLFLSELSPKPKDAALMYGYYYSSYGIPYRYYRPFDFEEGEFKGTNIMRSHKWISRMVRYGRRAKLSALLLTRPFVWFTKKRVYS